MGTEEASTYPLNHGEYMTLNCESITKGCLLNTTTSRPNLFLSDIGNICITGSEKTVIFSPCNAPSGRTYPIGASGAIISDMFDGTEYLCCFLAKDKRIVVFDLMNKVVVVSIFTLLLYVLQS